MDNKIKQDLLIEMLEYAQNPKRFSCEREGGFVKITGGRIKIRGFKPTLAERLLFKKIIDDDEEMLKRFYEKVKSYRGFCIEAGRKLMATYYSMYGYE
jgi:hypothetical protein